jgi:hypothetical protein
LLVVPQLPISLLRSGPFTNFTIPAIALGAVGLVAAVGAIASFWRHPLGSIASILAGGAIVCFEIVQAVVVGSLLNVPPGLNDRGYVALWLQPFYSILGAGIVMLGFFGVYRPWQLHWGATRDEIERQLPGDDIVAHPTFDATRAVTVEASPSQVWPWIAQIGFGRAGWYSYDLLDNLGRHSSETIIPALQQPHVGDLVPMGPGAGLYIKDFEPGKWMLWWDKRGRATWLWTLQDAGQGRTRMLTRVRLKYLWTSPGIVFNLLLIEPWDFPMMRKAMLGIKRRAESLAGGDTSGQARSQVRRSMGGS